MELRYITHEEFVGAIARVSHVPVADVDRHVRATLAKHSKLADTPFDGIRLIGTPFMPDGYALVIEPPIA